MSIQNSAEVLGSVGMHSLTQELKARYEDRLVIFDSPPIVGAGQMLAQPCVDCILMVVNESRTRMRDVNKQCDDPAREVHRVVMNQRKVSKSVYH